MRHSIDMAEIANWEMGFIGATEVAQQHGRVGESRSRSAVETVENIVSTPWTTMAPILAILAGMG